MALDTSKGKILSHHGTTVATPRGKIFAEHGMALDTSKGKILSHHGTTVATPRGKIFAEHGMALDTSKERDLISSWHDCSYF